MADTNMLTVRFRVYAPNGAALGVLPHPLSWEAGIPLNDMSSLTMTYPDGSSAANLLKNPCEVALELRNPDTGTFTEHAGCRFLNLRRSYDMAARPRIMSFTMPSYGWMLKKARFMDQDNPRLNKENQIVYKTSVSPALPVKDLLDYAHNRNNIPGLTFTFNNSVDSNGTAWGTTVKGASFDYAQDAWSIIDAFSRQGFFDWWINKRELELFKADGYLRRQLDTDTGVHIHSLLATAEEPTERTWEDLAGFIVALGDNTTSWLVEASNDLEFPWGKWDEAVSASGVSDDQTLAQITDRLLATKYKSRTQYTKRLAWTEGAPVPLVDYRPGDFIRALDDTGSQKASMRVYQITLSGTDPYGVSIALVLNDRFTDRALQTERWVARSSGSGGSVGGGGTGGGTAKPKTPPVNSTPPATPIDVSVTNEPYFSEIGDPVSMADVAFKVVTKDVNNRSIDVARYNVAARRSDFNFEQARVVQVRQPASPSTGQVIHAKVPLLDSGYVYYFSVQAIRDSGYASEWTDEVSQSMAYPTDAPPVPSAPILSSKLGTVKAEWDGEDSGGNDYPPEFREVQVEVSTNGSTWYHAGDIFSPGSSIIMSGKGGTPTWNIGDTVYVRFKARNSASVISSVSAVSQIVVVGVTSPDVEANSITANHIAVGTLTAQQIKSHSLSVDVLTIGDPNNLVIDPGMSSTVLNTARLTQATGSSSAGVAWSITSTGAVRVDNNVTTNATGRFGFTNNTQLNVALSDFPGTPLASPELAVPVTAPGNADGVKTGTLRARFVVKATGVPASPGASTINIGMFARQYQRSGAGISTAGVIIGDYTITANGTYTVESSSGFTVPTGVVGVIPYIYARLENGVSTDVALEFTQVEVWQESSVYIGNGLIRTPLIESNAITTALLNADAITAKHSIRSAYYEMVSQTSGPTVSITQNANAAGQAGLRWEGLIPAGGTGPHIFQTDAAGSGGWDARGFVITGPEATTNSSGRIDLQFAYGVSNSKISRNYGSETISIQGIFWDTSVARFRIGGMFNTAHYTNDMMRMDRVSLQNGTYSYGLATTRKYYPILCPNAGTTPVTSSIYQYPSGTEGGFQYVSSSGTEEVVFIAVCGTP
ncbi:hypothetical protein [Streptomyces cucumeris]|uniref:hypothetical protein n=1 Tax=Streptomyces cucumeris TaxID=2962890 RepID=UPI0020C8C9C7|nr:hypothetical protein [Streptomyces sp. NEAU-Y11]MCP9209714.1 hypothetical protein [Streptomyces sp. NEAU-Y11]